ncbi:hypothetical protein CHS0354_001778 [Potamilus streckersoni]|uniref:PID domain-containing protein n=1 Tax=Potamilus streckersoni TaxID=2493646 RepID=A0AAE0T1A6_9BIVA|nr:hypothetical protein CHS0354_001778 [Potamilus streckersoni]
MPYIQVKMFNKAKESVKITDKDPTFKARYIGSTETFQAAGKGCTTVPVQKLWDNAAEERYLKRVSLLLNKSGILIKDLDKKNDTGKLFIIENVSFCNVDCAVNEKIFSWVYQTETKRMECHAVLCSNAEKAKAMALVMARAFQIAYKEWKIKKSKEAKEMERSQRRVSIAKVSQSFEKKELQCQTNDTNETSSLAGSEPEPSKSGLITLESESLLGNGSVASHSRDISLQASINGGEGAS